MFNKNCMKISMHIIFYYKSGFYKLKFGYILVEYSSKSLFGALLINQMQKMHKNAATQRCRNVFNIQNIFNFDNAKWIDKTFEIF